MNATETAPIALRAREYLNHWVQLVAQHLQAASGQDLKAEMVSCEASSGSVDAKENAVWVRLAAPGSGEQAFSLDVQDAERLAQLMGARSPAEEAGKSPDPGNTVAGFFNELAGMIPLAEWLRTGGKLEPAGPDAPAWESSIYATFRILSAQNLEMRLDAFLSTGFVAALKPAPKVSKAEEESEAASGPGRFRTDTERVRDTHLDLLMDVELEAVLRFGQREMLLRDVLSLTPGTVLELNQQVHDPVELLVGNKVIAWGEVVTVDGNYGLRITGLASRKERLESLRK